MQGAYYVSVDDLAVGIYVHLDMRWVEHNFSLNSFKIKNVVQIAQIRGLGLEKIRIDPSRSAFLPEPWQELVRESAHESDYEADHEEADHEAAHESSAGSPASRGSGDAGALGKPVQAVTAAQAAPGNHPVIAERQEFLNQQRAALDACEKQFAQAATSLRSINADIHVRPQQARENATDLVQGILQTILSDKDVAIHLMNDKAGGEEMYFHALNVSVLAMMLAKELNMPAADIEQLGIGCLFHDIGKLQIPDRVLKISAPTRAEINLLQQHSAYGAAVGVKMGLTRQAIDIILQHHECHDGTGYPNMLIGEEISPLSRIAAIVNTYDNHCNPKDPTQSLTPYEALSHMYAHERHRFDVGYLSVFVRCMGVYPPGTLVRLTDESIGMVVAANFGMPLRPKILIFDPTVPKHEATVLDLQKAPELSVKDSLRAGEIGVEVYEYLSPRTHVTYFFESPKRDPSR